MNLAVLAVIIIIYLAIMSRLAYIGYRQTKSSDDYLVAGRDINPMVMALSYGATFISTSAIIGFGGVAGAFGFSLLWLVFLNIALGVLIAFAVFGVRIRQMSASMEASTLPSFLGERYQSRFIVLFTGLMIFLFMPAYTSIILVGGARFLQETLQLDYNVALFLLAVLVGIYVVSGGLRAVMYTDAFCAVVMAVGMAFLLVKSYSAVGGIIAGHQGLTEIAHLVPDSLKEIGHQGWTAMPRFGSALWWTVFSTIIMGVGIGVLAQPQLVVRFMTVRHTYSLYRAILVGGVFIFLTAGTAYIVGPLSNLYFYRTLGQISLEAAKGNMDLIMPMFIRSIMPTWFLYLFMLTLLSAAISTLSSLIHVQGAAFSKDILSTLGVVSTTGKKNYSELGLTRIGVVSGLAAAIFLAYVLPESVVARATAFWFGICAAGLLPALIGALYWKRATKAGAIASIVTGYSVSILGFVFLHVKESAPFGIAKALFGRDALLPFPWTHVDPLFYALPAAALVFVIVSLATHPLDKNHIERCFQSIK